MDEFYGGLCDSTYDDYYADKALMSPENLMIPAEHSYHNLISCNDHYEYYHPFLELENTEGNRFHGSAASEGAAASIMPEIQRGSRIDENGDHEEGYTMSKAKIASHPSYPKLLDAYIDCQKVGAPPEIASFLDEIRRETNSSTQNAVTTCYVADPELDEFMETYCDFLVKYKSDLSRPFNEATTFLDKIQAQLGNLCKDDDGALSSDEEFSGGEIISHDAQMIKSEERGLKDELLRKYGGHLSSLKIEFSKKKKKGKLPKEARQTLLEWWNVHYKWPYPTEADKISLAEVTGLDQKQINNWFINQRKRHWRPLENMQLAVMNNLSGQFSIDD